MLFLACTVIRFPLEQLIHDQFLTSTSWEVPWMLPRSWELTLLLLLLSFLLTLVMTLATALKPSTIIVRRLYVLKPYLAKVKDTQYQGG